MPVRKFKSLEEMEDSNWYEPGDPRLLSAIERVWRFARETCPVSIPPGVYHHRTIEEAQAQRELWEAANFRALWESRGVLAP
jgi:hypothetical protein